MRVALVFLLGATGCSYDWTVVPKADAGTVDAGSADAGSADAGPTACTDNAGCGPKAYCAFPDRECGAGAEGTCQERVDPAPCSKKEVELVCTCDGTIATNRCAAAAAGTDLARAEGRCKTPDAGVSPCVFGYCAQGTLCSPYVKLGVLNYQCEPDP